MASDDAQILAAMTDQIGFLLRIAQLDAFEQLYDKADLSDAGLTELTILHLVAQFPGIRQGILANALRIKRAHMTKIVRASLARGLLAAEVPAEDRRAVSLSLTAAGADLVARAWPELQRAESNVAANLDPAEKAQLCGLLSKLLGLNSAATLERV